MGDIARDFSYSEFACPCGKCSLDGHSIDIDLVHNLQTIRTGLGKALHINSGCRCLEYNRAVGGVDLSYHLTFQAVDVDCTNSTDRHIIVKAALMLGLTVGIANTFIHLDNRDKPIIFLY